jgi:TetR/AcrR family transcriptional repressor of nem operon
LRALQKVRWLIEARAIYAAVVGAQLVARSRSDIGRYDSLIDGYRSVGFVPA